MRVETWVIMPEQIRVLLADDEERFSQSLAKVLRNRNMEVCIAYDGESAIRFLSHEECDVILLDLRMPGMDGLATLQEIRRIKPLTPVILLTGSIDMARVSSALKGGAAEVLLKPCPIDTLTSAIENAYERRLIVQEMSGGTL